MSQIPHPGQIEILANPNGSIASVTYNGYHLPNFLAATLSPIGITQQFAQAITDILDFIHTLPRTQRARGVRVADNLFNSLFDAYRLHFGLDNPKLLAEYWYSIQQIVTSWETKHRRIHKGSLYYWLGYSHLVMGDVTSAYFAFFNAIEEDKRNWSSLGVPYARSPASLTMTLLDVPQNALHRSVVLPLRSELSRLLTSYQRIGGSNLSMQDIDRKFFANNKHKDIRILFTSTFHELYNIRRLINSNMSMSEYSKVRIGNLMFSLCLVIDILLEYRFLSYSKKFKRAHRDMGKAIYLLFISNNITTERKTPIRSFFDKLRPPKHSSIKQALTILLSNRGMFEARTMPPVINAVLVTYRLRNFLAHNIKGEATIVKRYGEIFSAIMNAFFFSIDILKP